MMMGAAKMLGGMKKGLKPLSDFTGKVKKAAPELNMANAAMNGFKESLSGLSEPFTELGQIIGDSILPIIDPITDFLYDAVDALEPFADGIEYVATVIGEAIPSFDEASVWFGQLANELDIISDSSDIATRGLDNFIVELDQMLVDWMQKMGIFYTDAINSIVDWINNIDWDEVAENLAEFVNSIGEWFMSIDWVDTIGSHLMGMITAITDWIANIDWVEVGEALRGFVDGIGTFFANIDWDGLFTGVKDFFMNLPGQILQWLMDGMNALGDLGSEVGGAWADLWAGTGWF